MVDTKKVGVFIAQCRKEHNWTQKELGEKLGVTDKAVSKWENGTSDPSTSNLIAIAELYGVSSEELLRSTNAGCQKNSKEKK